MSGIEGRPARRRRVPRAAQTPRVGDLDALLRDVDTLRLRLETDLTLAASAVEAGEPALAAEILDSDRAALGSFEAQALGRLDALATAGAPEAPRRAWVPPHAASLVAAAAMVGLLAGVVPLVISSRHPGAPSAVAASESLERLQQLVLSGDTSEIRAASDQLHAQLAGMVATASSDPAAAQNALLLLTYEQQAIAHSADRSMLGDVLAQSEALARAIRAALPRSARVAVPAAAPSADSGTGPDATSATRSTPAPAATSSAKSSPAPKSSPTPSASPSPSPTNPYPLPNSPLQP